MEDEFQELLRQQEEFLKSRSNPSVTIFNSNQVKTKKDVELLKQRRDNVRNESQTMESTNSQSFEIQRKQILGKSTSSLDPSVPPALQKNLFNNNNNNHNNNDDIEMSDSNNGVSKKRKSVHFNDKIMTQHIVLEQEDENSKQESLKQTNINNNFTDFQELKNNLLELNKNKNEVQKNGGVDKKLEIIEREIGNFEKNNENDMKNNVGNGESRFAKRKRKEREQEEKEMKSMNNGKSKSMMPTLNIVGKEEKMMIHVCFDLFYFFFF